MNILLTGHGPRIIPQGRNASAQSLSSNRLPSKQPIPGTNGYGQASVSSADTRMETSGNQVMIQRQKPNRPSLASQNQQQQRQEVQQSSTQKHDSLGVISMEEVLEDLQVLEQQQQESKRKLAHAQATKQNRINQQKQLNAQLEGKKYSNGALYAQVEQSRKFLSGATRDLSACKLVTERLTKEISGFERKLKQSLYFARMVVSSNQKIESVIISVEHKIANVVRLKTEAREVIKILQKQVSSTEERDRMIRSAIQEAHANGHNCAEEQAGLRVANSKLENDRIAAQNLNQSTKLKCDGVRDQIKKMEERAAHSKAVQLQDLEVLAQHEDGFMLEQEALAVSILDADKLMQLQKEGVLEFQKHLDFELVYDSDDGIPNTVDSFGPPLAAMEAEGNHQDADLKLLDDKLHEVEEKLKRSEDEILQNDALASKLLQEAESQAEEEAEREKSAVAFERDLAFAVEEVSNLDGSFVDLQKIRDTEATVFAQSVAECEDEITQHEQTIATMEKQIRMADNACRTQTRLFEETEKPKLLLLEREAANRSSTAEDHHKSLVERSSGETMEADLNTEYDVKRKMEQEKFDERCRKLDGKRDKYIEKYPRLAAFIVSVNHKRPIVERWEDILEDLNKECESRQAEARSKQAARAQVQDDEIQQLDVATANIRKREDQRRKRSKKLLGNSHHHPDSELNENGNHLPSQEDAITEVAFASNDPVVNGARLRRRKKGSDFFNPRNDDNVGFYEEETPAHPKQLFTKSVGDPRIRTSSTSILPSTTDKRVHWEDGDSMSVGDNENATVNASTQIEFSQSDSKSRDTSLDKNRKLGSSSYLNRTRTSHSKTTSSTRISLDHADEPLKASEPSRDTSSRLSGHQGLATQLKGRQLKVSKQDTEKNDTGFSSSLLPSSLLDLGEGIDRREPAKPDSSHSPKSLAFPDAKPNENNGDQTKQRLHESAFRDDTSKTKNKTKSGLIDDLHASSKAVSSKERGKTEGRSGREIHLSKSSDSFHQKQLANSKALKNRQEKDTRKKSGADSDTHRRERQRHPSTSRHLDTATIEPASSLHRRLSRSRSSSNPGMRKKNQESSSKRLSDSAGSEGRDDKKTKTMYDSNAKVKLKLTAGIPHATSKENSRRSTSPMNSTETIAPSRKKKTRSGDSNTKSPKEKRRESKESTRERLQVLKESVKKPPNSNFKALSLLHPIRPPQKRKDRDHTSASEASSNMTKARRRRKKDSIGSQRSFATAMTADTFNFSF